MQTLQSRKFEIGKSDKKIIKQKKKKDKNNAYITKISTLEELKHNFKTIVTTCKTIV